MGSCLSSNTEDSRPAASNLSNKQVDSVEKGETAQVSDPSSSVKLRDSPTGEKAGNIAAATVLAHHGEEDKSKSDGQSPKPPSVPSPSLQPAAEEVPSTSQQFQTSSQQILENALAGRPKSLFGPQDSRASVYSDIGEIEPILAPGMPALPANAQIPSASVTPAGNVLMHLNRAMILQHRAGQGATVPSIPLGKCPDKDPAAGDAAPGHCNSKGSLRVATVQAQAAQHIVDGFPALGHGGSGSFGPDAMGDSGIFDSPAAMTSAGPAGTPVAGGTFNSSQASIASTVTGNTGAADNSTGGGSLNGMSATLSAVPSFSISAMAGVSGSGGSVFAAPLHGLGVEATLGEMHQMALIGSGGGGCVYIGRWRGVTVAIKFIVSSNDDQLTRSQREALMSRLASHPHVVQTYATSVTQLAEQMFKPKEGAIQHGAMATADPNISHDLLAGLTSGSWIRGELQMALNGPSSNTAGPGTGAAYGAPGGPPLPTIMETARSSAGSLSASISGRGAGAIDGNRQGSVPLNHATTCDSDCQLSSSSASRAKGAQETAQQGQNDASFAVSGSGAQSCHTSNASSVVGGPARLLQSALVGAGPMSGGLATGSAPLSSESPAGAELGDVSQPAHSNRGGLRQVSNAGDAHSDREAAPGTAGAPGTQGGTENALQNAPGNGAGAAAAASAIAGGRGQQSGGVADSFDASFVRDHLGRANYAIHEVLRQLGAHEGQFLTMVVMEYCDGGSLLAALKEGPFHRDTTSWSPRMLLRSTVRTALEIAHGMQHLHLSGLVHGDLKPGNVLLKGSNQDKRKFVAKVSDLGIAHPVGNADEMAIDDGQIGSIAYMAPEVFRGRVMKASDVYSFGVLLWQLACGTGAAPYEGAHPIAIALGVSEGKMSLRWPPGVFRPLQQLGELCTQTDPAARPSFKSVVGALEKLERHMQRLAAAASAGPSSVSMISPASSANAPHPVSLGAACGNSPSSTLNSITGQR